MFSPRLVRRAESDRIAFAFVRLRDSQTYKLAVALPVPGKLLWSVTVCDSRTGKPLLIDRESATTRASFELKDEVSTSLPRHFGPVVPNGARRHWIKTMSGRGWFTHLRIYAPSGPHSIVDGARATFAVR